MLGISKDIDWAVPYGVPRTFDGNIKWQINIFRAPQQFMSCLAKNSNAASGTVRDLPWTMVNWVPTGVQHKRYTSTLWNYPRWIFQLLFEWPSTLQKLTSKLFRLMYFQAHTCPNYVPYMASKLSTPSLVDGSCIITLYSVFVQSIWTLPTTVYVTGFEKTRLPHTSNFSCFIQCNFFCKCAEDLKISH